MEKANQKCNGLTIADKGRSEAAFATIVANERVTRNKIGPESECPCSALVRPEAGLDIQGCAPTERYGPALS